MRNAFRATAAAVIPPIPSGVRNFHLESKDIPKFLYQIGTSLPTSASIETTPLPTSSTEGVAVLISADRDPQPLTSGKFYGPSILSAPLSSLNNLDKTFFGKGGLGLLKLRRVASSAITSLTVRTNTRTLPQDQLNSLVHGLGSNAAQVVSKCGKSSTPTKASGSASPSSLDPMEECKSSNHT